MNRGLVFRSIKEHRSGYFAEYSPAAPEGLFASLTLTFLQRPEPAGVAELMRQESEIWTRRFPVPLMVSSFDDSGHLIQTKPKYGCDHLFALPTNDGTAHHWKMLDDSEFPRGPLLEEDLLNVYREVPFTTLEERCTRAESRAKRIRRVIRIIAWWGLAVPITVALIGMTSPVLGYVIIAFSIGKAALESLRVLSYVKRSGREEQKSREELRMRHHHYHCERNPDGFLRLKAENIEREARDETRREAQT